VLEVGQITEGIASAAQSRGLRTEVEGRLRNSRGFFHLGRRARRGKGGVVHYVDCAETAAQRREMEKAEGNLVKRESAQWWMPRYEPTMKDVASCEKLRGAASKHRSGDVRMGKPGGGDAPSSRKRSQPGELKHLSTRRKRNQKRDSVSSGERKRKSPNREALRPCGVVGP
jgi:hypothetical protein